jgi:hypothetical protein
MIIIYQRWHRKYTTSLYSIIILLNLDFVSFIDNNDQKFNFYWPTNLLYIKDKTISPKIQSKVTKNTNIQNIINIESDHMVMLSHPKELFDAIQHI